MYKENSIKTRLKQLNKRMQVVNKSPILVIVSRTDDNKQWNVGITKYYGVVGQSESKNIVCDDYTEYTNKIEKAYPDTTIIINDIEALED